MCEECIQLKEEIKKIWETIERHYHRHQADIHLASQDMKKEIEDFQANFSSEYDDWHDHDDMYVTEDDLDEIFVRLNRLEGKEEL